jgi:uncharacterized protein YjbI with pentapeptide repeats
MRPSARKGSDRVKAPREPAVSLPTLTRGTSAGLERDTEHDGAEFVDLQVQTVDSGNCRFLECRLAGCSFEDVRLRRSRFNTCILQDLEANAFDVTESEWSDVSISGGRFGAFLAPGATLDRVVLEGVRSNYVNFRGSTITDLVLRNCRIEELDLGSARVTRASLAGSDIERLILSEATLIDVDLHEAALASIEDIAYLRGSTISEVQMTRLAPAFAQHLGIRVVDADQL